MVPLTKQNATWITVNLFIIYIQSQTHYQNKASILCRGGKAPFISHTRFQIIEQKCYIFIALFVLLKVL